MKSRNEKQTNFFLEPKIMQFSNGLKTLGSILRHTGISPTGVPDVQNVGLFCFTTKRFSAPKQGRHQPSDVRPDLSLQPSISLVVSPAARHFFAMTNEQRQLLNAIRRAMEMNRQAQEYLKARSKQEKEPIPPPPDFMLEALRGKE